MKKMPERSSRPWWRLWFSGAINKTQTFRSVLADELIEYQKEDSWYWEDLNAESIRRGKLLTSYPRGLLDLAARICQDLRIHKMKVVDKLFIDLIGKTGTEADKAWKD